MKKIITFAFFVLLFSTQVAIAQCSRTGNFMPTDVPTKGSVTLLFDSDGTIKIQMGSAFLTYTGPDLHVVLSKTATYNATTSVTISGVLTQAQASGAQTFTVTSPKVKNINDYQFILIHCIRYNHLFGYAALGNSSGAGCATLATDSFDSDYNSISVYPNPTKDKVTFSVQDEANVSIYNNLGRKISSNQLITKENNSLSLDYFSKGIYFVEITSNNKKITKKIIKN